MLPCRWQPPWPSRQSKLQPLLSLVYISFRNYHPQSLPFVPIHWNDGMIQRPRIFANKNYTSEQIQSIVKRMRMLVSVTHVHNTPRLIDELMGSWNAIHRQNPSPLCQEVIQYLKPLETAVERILLNNQRYDEAVAMIGVDFRNDRWMTDSNLPQRKRWRLANTLMQAKQISSGKCSALEFFTMIETIESRPAWEHLHGYEKGLRLVATPSPDFESFASALFDYFGNDHTAISGVITSIMRALAKFDPQAVISYWKYKLKRYPKRLLPEDLKLAMMAFIDTKQFANTTAIYHQHPHLHDDSQLTVLLELLAEEKAWLELQDQFEAMYGRNNLPYVVHYALVMRTLASIGADGEVNQLYKQMKERNIPETVPVAAARVSSALKLADVAKAENAIRDYENSDVMSKYGVGYLHHKVFKYHLQVLDSDTVWNYLQRVLSGNDVSVNAFTIKLAIKYFSGTFNLDKVVSLENFVANHPRYNTSLVRLALADAYSSLDQFERAKQLVDDLHLDTQFSHPQVYASQLRLYRHNYTDYTTPLALTVVDVINITLPEGYWAYRQKPGIRPNQRLVSPHNRGKLYMEIIKLLVARNRVDDAMATLSRARAENVLSESHYLPIMAYYTKEGHFDSHQKVIYFYREMTAAKVKMTLAIYVEVMKSVAFLDHQDGNFSNSFKFFASILELYSITVEGSRFLVKKPLSLNVLDLINLCKVAATYMHALGRANSLQIMVNFLDLVKLQLIPLHDLRLKMVVYTEMLTILDAGDARDKVMATAWQTLMTNVHQYVERYPFDAPAVVPRSLNNYAQRLAAMTRDKLDVDTVYDLWKNGVTVGGLVYNTVFVRELFAIDDANLTKVLEICESELALGSKRQYQLRQRLQKMYPLAIDVLVARGKLQSTPQLSLLHKYYGVNVDGVVNKDAEAAIAKFNRVFRQEGPKVNPHRHNPEWALNHPTRYFSPDVDISTHNKMNDNTSKRLWKAIRHHYRTKLEIQGLRNKYPGIMSHLAKWNANRVKSDEFQRGIDELVPSPGPEPTAQKKKRTKRALRMNM